MRLPRIKKKRKTSSKLPNEASPLITVTNLFFPRATRCNVTFVATFFFTAVLFSFTILEP